MWKEDEKEWVELLREFEDETIEDIYDIYHDATDGLIALLPNFEYPDWSYKTVKEFLTYCFEERV